MNQNIRAKILTGFSVLLILTGLWMASKRSDSNERFSANLHEHIPPTILTDGLMPEQVLKISFSDVLKFTENGRIELIARSHLPAEIELQKKGSGEFVAFEVMDTGTGIPQEKQALVFEAKVNPAKEAPSPC